MEQVIVQIAIDNETGEPIYAKTFPEAIYNENQKKWKYSNYIYLVNSNEEEPKRENIRTLKTINDYILNDFFSKEPLFRNVPTSGETKVGIN